MHLKTRIKTKQNHACLLLLATLASYLFVDNSDEKSLLLSVLCDDCQILLPTATRLPIYTQLTVSCTDHLQQKVTP